MKYCYIIYEFVFCHDDYYYDSINDIRDYFVLYSGVEENCIMFNQDYNKLKILCALFDVEEKEVYQIKENIYNLSCIDEEDCAVSEPFKYKILSEDEFLDLCIKWISNASDIDKSAYLIQLKKLLCENLENLFDRKLYNSLKSVIKEEENKNLTSDKIMNKVMDLEGAVDFKQYMSELDNMRDLLVEYNTKKNFPTQHFIFASDYGNGSSEALKLMHEYIRTTQLYYVGGLSQKLSLYRDEFVFSSTDSPSQTVAMKFDTLKEKITDLSSGIIGIHVEEWLGKLEDSLFTDMLNFCFELRNSYYFVFMIPYVDEGTLNRVYKRISDILNVKIIRFKPYTDVQLINIIKKEFNALNFTYDNSIDVFLKRALIEERNLGKFTGVKTAKRIATQIARNELKQCSFDDNVIDKDSFNDFFEINDLSLTGFEELDTLIGLDEVKKRIKEIVVSIKNQKRLSENGLIDERPCYHMMFTGNPGTGKTAVARIIGKIFRENGLLPAGDLFEVSRFDLVGEFIGQTAIKTLGVCKNAIGSVMFLDEAYLLSAGSVDKNDADFGAEALGMLISEMENHRDEFAVIFAGYKNEIDRLYSLNAGLKDRIPHRIHFPNYTKDELFQIFKLMLRDKYDVEDNVYLKAKEYFLSLPKELIEDEEFGNARFVRNLVERIRIKAYLRLQHNLPEKGKIKIIEIDFESAINDNDIKSLKYDTTKKLGFQYRGCN